MKYGVSKGSILSPLLFNIFMCDLFLVLDKMYFVSFADDNTPYTVQKILAMSSNL